MTLWLCFKQHIIHYWFRLRASGKKRSWLQVVLSQDPECSLCKFASTGNSQLKNPALKWCRTEIVSASLVTFKRSNLQVEARHTTIFWSYFIMYIHVYESYECEYEYEYVHVWALVETLESCKGHEVEVITFQRGLSLFHPDPWLNSSSSVLTVAHIIKGYNR